MTHCAAAWPPRPIASPGVLAAGPLNLSCFLVFISAFASSALPGGVNKVVAGTPSDLSGLRAGDIGQGGDVDILTPTAQRANLQHGPSLPLVSSAQPAAPDNGHALASGPRA